MLKNTKRFSLTFLIIAIITGIFGENFACIVAGAAALFFHTLTIDLENEEFLNGVEPKEEEIKPKWVSSRKLY